MVAAACVLEALGVLPADAAHPPAGCCCLRLQPLTLLELLVESPLTLLRQRVRGCLLLLCRRSRETLLLGVSLVESPLTLLAELVYGCLLGLGSPLFELHFLIDGTHDVLVGSDVVLGELLCDLGSLSLVLDDLRHLVGGSLKRREVDFDRTSDKGVLGGLKLLLGVD